MIEEEIIDVCKMVEMSVEVIVDDIKEVEIVTLVNVEVSVDVIVGVDVVVTTKNEIKKEALLKMQKNLILIYLYCQGRHEIHPQNSQNFFLMR